MQHPDEGTIHAWLDESDALSARERAELAEHVASCPQCREAVAEARGMIAGASRIVASLDVVRGDVIPATPASTPQPRPARFRKPVWRLLRLTPARAALAATILLAIAIQQGMKARGSEGGSPRAASASMKSDTVAAAAPTPAAAPAPPRSPVLAPSPRPAIARVVEVPASKKSTSESIASSERFGSAEKTRRGDTSGKALVSVATTGAQASASTAAIAGTAAPAPPPPVAFDSTRARMAVRAEVASRRAASSAVVARPLGSRALDLTEAANVAMGPPYTGCYEIVNDTGASRLEVPPRFWLQHASPVSRSGASPLRSVARALMPDGRFDASVPDGTWRAVGQAVVQVSWPSVGAGASQAALTMSFGPAAVTGEMAAANGMRRVEIRRIDCPR